MEDLEKIRAWQEQIDQVNRANGWRETTPTLPEAMTLLVSEAIEAFEAWRRWGLRDATPPPVVITVDGFADPLQTKPPKPEGVGSEFADIGIRLLDDLLIFGMRIEPGILAGAAEVRATGQIAYEDGSIQFTLDSTPPRSLGDAMWRFTKNVVAAESVYEAGGPGAAGASFTILWLQLRHYSLMFEVDLDMEIDRKIGYNRTRGYRHGGKRL